MSSHARHHEIPGAGCGHTAHHTDYLAGDLGTVTLTPSSSIVAGEYVSLALRFTAGRFGVDDTGSIRISTRLVSDIGRPQFTDPAAPNYVTATASNGAALQLTYDPHLNMRPWNPTLTVKVRRGFLSAGETITVTLGDCSGGSPGLRMQTFCEETFRFLVLADVFATCNWALLPDQPALRIVPGPAETFKALLPTLRRPGEPFALTLRADDRWGNPTERMAGHYCLSSTHPIAGLPESFVWPEGERFARFEGLTAKAADRVEIAWRNEAGEILCQSNPLRLADAEYLPFWADLHGQSGETVGTGSVTAYAAYARDEAAIDVICHQGNDFQITPSIWGRINDAAARTDVPGRFVFLPGYEWSGNSGLGGDRNVIYPDEGRRILRSSHALVEDTGDADGDAHDAHALHAALKREGAAVLCIPHVGGRYANLFFAHDPALERAVEVHSDWGTFDWLLHDAFAVGGRVGIVANSDGHQGRQGASHPGAATFGSYGGLTAILADDLSRKAVFETLRRRRHYATTNAARHLLETHVALGEEAELHHDDPILGGGPVGLVQRAMMGDILTHVRDKSVEFSFAISGQAPIERVEVFNRMARVGVWRPYAAADLGRRIRLVVEGSEYRGRGRETHWTVDAAVSGNQFARVLPINRWNHDKNLTQDVSHIRFEAVTTGGFAGVDVTLKGGASGIFDFETPFVAGSVDIADLGLDDSIFAAGGLGRQVRITRLPDVNPHKQANCRMQVPLTAVGDNALYIRVTFEDGSVGWTSPIYLIASDGRAADLAKPAL